VRKVLIVLTGIIFFYIVRVFFKSIRRQAARNSSNFGTRDSDVRVNNGKSFISDRVVEEADYVEISGDPAK
jgi:hypothetical protein